MASFLKVAAVSELPPGGAKVVEAQGKEIALFNVNGSLYALDNLCPHAGGPLAEGTVQEDAIECPWHGACFNLKTGKSSSPLADDVSAYPVRVAGSDIEIEL